MFAVVRTGGKQYRVAPGDKIVVEKLDGSAGDRVTLGDVLLAGDGGSLKSAEGLTVAAEIVAQAKADKVTVFKKRRRHNYRRKKGHRQQHTILKILAIGDQQDDKPAQSGSAAKAAKAGKGKQAEAPTSEETSSSVAGTPTANPAPNGDQSGETKKRTKPASGKKSTAADESASAASTENAAPAKGGSKTAPKAE